MKPSAMALAAIQLLRDIADRIETGELDVATINTGITHPVVSDSYIQQPFMKLEVQTFVIQKKSDC